MKHFEKALEVANEERARQRDRLRVIDASRSLPPLKASEAANDAPAKTAEPQETHMQAAIRKAKSEATAASEPPVLSARLAPQRTAAPGVAQPAARPSARPAQSRAPKEAPPSKPPLDLTSIVYSETRVLDRPSQALSKARIVAGDGGDAVTRAYKMLRTQVLHRMAEKGWQTLAVVSPGASEGKTLTAINLGIALAGSVQHSVMLVDCDWRKPSVHKYFDYEPEHDISSYLSGREPLSSALVNPGIARFCFLPCRAPITQSSERLGSALVGKFVAELRNRYRNRIVLFDLPPMLLTDDCLSFLPHVDCALVVVEEDRTSREALEQTLEMIGRDKLLGTVLNKSRVALAEY
jgi:Mrp family chromosome partitioning ATPase